MSLAQLQQDFLTSMNSDHDDLTKYITADLAANLTADLTGKSGDHVPLTPIDRINIYRNNTQQARVRALKDIYPITEGVLGERFFDMICHRYSQHHPATHWDLNQYGHTFPQFIAAKTTDFEGLSELPYLEQLGQLEWRLHQAYYAADSSGFPLEQFSNLDVDSQQGCRLMLAPSVGLIQSDWPIYELWQCWQQGKLPDTLPTLTETEYLCVSRDHYQPTVDRLSPELYVLLTYLPNHSLSALSEQADLGTSLALLPHCINQGWITDFRLPDSTYV